MKKTAHRFPFSFFSSLLTRVFVCTRCAGSPGTALNASTVTPPLSSQELWNRSARPRWSCPSRRSPAAGSCCLRSAETPDPRRCTPAALRWRAIPAAGYPRCPAATTRSNSKRPVSDRCGRGATARGRLTLFADKRCPRLPGSSRRRCPRESPGKVRLIRSSREYQPAAGDADHIRRLPSCLCPQPAWPSCSHIPAQRSGTSLLRSSSFRPRALLPLLASTV